MTFQSSVVLEAILSPFLFVHITKSLFFYLIRSLSVLVDCFALSGRNILLISCMKCSNGSQIKPKVWLEPSFRQILLEWGYELALARYYLALPSHNQSRLHKNQNFQGLTSYFEFCKSSDNFNSGSILFSFTF